jgi:protein SCO1/2
MSKPALRFFLLLLVAAGALAAGWLLHPGASSRSTTLPVLGRVPDYTLTDQLGQQVSSTSFYGKVRVVTFLFPYCRGYCPLIAHNLVSLERALRASGHADQVQLVAFNVDPENTGPTQMRRFQEQYGWNPANRRWEYLTGPPQAVRDVVTGGYHVYFEKVTGDDDARNARAGEDGPIPEPVVQNRLADEAGVRYDIVHNDLLAIVDARGRIRRIFSDAERLSDEEMLEVIDRLLPSGGRPSEK